MTEILKVRADSKEIIGETSFVENAEIELNENETILSVSARSLVKNVEPLSNEFRVTIDTVFCAIIINDTGYETKSTRVESVKNVSLSGVTPNSNGTFFVRVSDCECSSSGKATATLTLFGWYVKNNEIEYLGCENQGIFCRTQKHTVKNIADNKDSYLDLTSSDEFRMPIKKVLDCMPVVNINNVYPAEGSFRIEGEQLLRLTVVTDNDQYVTQTFTHPFSTEVSSDKCTIDSDVDIVGVVKKCEITVSDGDKRVFISDTELNFFATVTEQKDIDGVSDCYSVTNELTKVYSSAFLNKDFCLRSLRDKASFVLKLNEDITELYCVLNPSVSSAGARNDETLKVEGIISVTVLYSGDENKPRAKVAEIPFVSEMSKEFACAELFTPIVTVNALTARIKTGKEIEVSVEYSVILRGRTQEEVKLVSSVEIGDQKPEDDYAISLYIVKPHEELWDVAKALNTDEDTLLRLNPDLKLPLTGGEKILIYKELLFNM